MQRLRKTPQSKVPAKSKQKQSPEYGKRKTGHSKAIVSNLQLEATYLSKQLSMELQENNQTINLLREENLSMQDEIRILKGKINMFKRLSNINEKADHMLIEDDSINEKDEVKVIMDVRSRLEDIIDENLTKDIGALAKISRELSKMLRNDPSYNKPIEQSMNSLEESINKLTERYLQEQIFKNLADWKDALKKERESLKTSLQETINTNIKHMQEKEEIILAKQMQVLTSLPQGLKQLKDFSRKREQDYKRQVLFLEKKIIAISEQNRQTIDAQNTLIEQLRESLANLKDTYNKQVQIPIFKIRQTVQKEIRLIKSEFSNIHENTTLNVMIANLIEALSKYTESKNLANNQEMRDQIKKINEKLSVVNNQSIRTIAQVKQIIKSSNQITLDYNILAKTHKKEELISIKKKEKDELELEVKCEKQKQYIQMLEKYNKKLEQSVMRTQKQGGKHLYDQWKAIEGQFRVRESDLREKLNSIESEITTSKSQIIEIKKTALSILQTERSLTALFESFEAEIASIKSFKDELFNFLENELKFRQEINKQVQLFNRMFVDEYNKLSKLQQVIPKTEPLEENVISHRQFSDALLGSITNYNKFRQDYEGMFKSKSNIDIKFQKYFTSITQLQEEFSKLTKNRTEKLTFQLNFQPIKTHINSAILRIEDLLTSTKIIKESVLKNLMSLKQEVHLNVEQYQKIFKFIKQSKLYDTITVAYQLFEGKNRLLHNVQQLLSQFTGSQVLIDSAQESLFSDS